MAYTQADADEAAHDLRIGREKLATLTNEHSVAKLAGRSTHAAENRLFAMLVTVNGLIEHQREIEAAMASVKPV